MMVWKKASKTKESVMPEDKIGNWGKWGAEDQIGALNYITPEVIKQAASLVKKGKVYSLAIPLEKEAPIWPARNKLVHIVSYSNDPSPGGRGGAEDILTMHTHGTTHMDTLAHVWYDSKLYNGWPASVVSSRGTEKNAMDNVKGLVGRGVLLDMAGFKGVDALGEGYTITPKDIEDCLNWEGVSIRSGDVVLLRTGCINVLIEGSVELDAGEPGIGMEAAMWLMEREVCAIGADNNSVEVLATKKLPVTVPIHRELIRNQGCYLIELLQLNQLAEDKTYEFLFVAAPLQLVRGLGSPLNPLAIA